MIAISVILLAILLYLTYRYVKYTKVLRKINSAIYAYAYYRILETGIEEEIDPWDQFHYDEIQEKWYMYVFCLRPLNMSLFYDHEDVKTLMHALRWRENLES